MAETDVTVLKFGREMFMTILEQFPDIQNDINDQIEQKELQRLNMEFI